MLGAALFENKRNFVAWPPLVPRNMILEIKLNNDCSNGRGGGNQPNLEMLGHLGEGESGKKEKSHTV